MKKIAFYLPQYHIIPENDKWWGKGFTEWTNVRKSKSTFRGHVQPEIPLHENYYNLLDKSVMEKQSQLALEYGIDGFCYYHYWFDGKLLLEKPLELMLENKNVSIPFMLCWANESWARTWDGREKQILIEQNYEEDELGWREHFDYVLKFFKDNRYIKINNRPVMILYKPHLITSIGTMMEKWNLWAVENGFDGIYWGFQHHGEFEYLNRLKNFDFGIEFEPFYTVWSMSKCGNSRNTVKKFFKKIEKKILRRPTIYDYDDIWHNIVNRKESLFRVMPGAFTAWDNTPRRGRNAAVFFEATPQKFKMYLKEKIKNSEKYSHPEFIFINAWNEWAEGAHLEPDEYNGFGYLEAVKSCKEDIE